MGIRPSRPAFSLPALSWVGLLLAGSLLTAGGAAAPVAEGATAKPTSATAPGKGETMTAPPMAEEPVSMKLIWEELARARVLVRIQALGPDRLRGKSRKMAWIETLRRLHEVLAADPSCAGRVHEVAIREMPAPGASIAATGLEGPVVLLLDFARPVKPKAALAAAGPTGATFDLILPEAAGIAAALHTRGPRPRLDLYEFDDRFPRFLARLGLGLAVRKPDLRDASGRPAFHQVLSQYGERVKQLLEVPVAGFDKARDLGHWRRAVTTAVDRRFNPQLALSAGSRPDAGFEPNRAASFPPSAPSKVVGFLTFSLTDGRVNTLPLDEVDQCAARWLEEWKLPTGHAFGLFGACSGQPR
ncbi:MAG: hypothetical protein HY814_02800 [Candidatus Riflebacteria bacterium]|nr:hypothetical protein [Candidatus Riflebacteria bacterium]